MTKQHSNATWPWRAVAPGRSERPRKARVDARELLQVRRSPLDREEEIELAKCIEQANRDMLDAVVRSPQALDELFSILDEVKDGARSMDATFVSTGDPRDREQIVAEIQRAVSAARAGSAAARAAFIDTVTVYGPTHALFEELLGRLEAVAEELRGPARRSLTRTITDISRSHRASERARRTFVEANIGLVVMMASKRIRDGLVMGDLVQEGCMGLMRAVEKFDHRRGVRFSTYAAWWIRHAINRALSDRSRTIRVPVHLLETRHKMARSAQDFRQRRGREPTDQELSEHAGIPEERLRALSAIPREPVSMDAPVGPGAEVRVGDFVADTESATAVDEISGKHVRHRVRSLLGTLPEREAAVLRLRFGIDTPDTLTLEQIGQRYGLSRERIRQIEAEALTELRSRATAEELDSHLAG